MEHPGPLVKWPPIYWEGGSLWLLADTPPTINLVWEAKFFSPDLSVQATVFGTEISGSCESRCGLLDFGQERSPPMVSSWRRPVRIGQSACGTSPAGSPKAAPPDIRARCGHCRLLPTARPSSPATPRESCGSGIRRDIRHQSPEPGDQANYELTSKRLMEEICKKRMVWIPEVEHVPKGDTIKGQRWSSARSRSCQSGFDPSRARAPRNCFVGVSGVRTIGPGNLHGARARGVSLGPREGFEPPKEKRQFRRKS
jgi:hypothetical protein